jgi:hypothetical protein
VSLKRHPILHKHHEWQVNAYFWQAGNGGDGLNFAASDADKKHQLSTTFAFSIPELSSTSTSEALSDRNESLATSGLRIRGRSQPCGSDSQTSCA